MTTPAHPKLAEAADRARGRRNAYEDHAAGLVYMHRIGPEVPGLDARGLGYVRDDCLRDAERADEQGRAAEEAGNYTLATICQTTARVRREVAKQLAAYALIPTWSVPSAWEEQA